MSTTPESERTPPHPTHAPTPEIYPLPLHAALPIGALVTGAGGFIGPHLVKHQKGEGLWVRAVDIKKLELDPTPADEFLVTDLRELIGGAWLKFRLLNVDSA